ncbi:hypothetical protein Tco_0511112 [Tanacetum coccineum]
MENISQKMNDNDVQEVNEEIRAKMDGVGDGIGENDLELNTGVFGNQDNGLSEKNNSDMNIEVSNADNKSITSDLVANRTESYVNMVRKDEINKKLNFMPIVTNDTGIEVVVTGTDGSVPRIEPALTTEGTGCCKVGGGGDSVGGCGERCGGSSGSGGFMAERGGGSLAKHSMDSKKGLVGAEGGEVKGGEIDFRVSKSLLGEIPKVIISEGGGELFGDDGGAVWKRISDKRTKNQAKTDKIEHGMEKRGKAKVKSKPKSNQSQNQPGKSNSQTDAVNENT